MIDRRSFLAASAALSVARPALASSAFPKSFLWGASTSALQIEGGADTRPATIWDEFAQRPGKIADGSDPGPGADDYRRWPETVRLLKGANLGAYRFGISWPRVLAGQLDHYERQVDALLAAGIRPMPCLYHWDLPLELHQRGGWLNRDIALWFADYADTVSRRLGDRVGTWFTLNEPNVHAIFGYGKGEHAPGLRGDHACLAAMHHQNLAQGAAFRALRANMATARLGTVLSLQPVVPATEADRDAARMWDALWNRVALDGVMLGRIPDALAAPMAGLVRDGDLETIRFPLDVLGINYYSRMTVRREPGNLLDVGWAAPKTRRVTAMGWPVEPDGLTEMLVELKERYGDPAMMVTENGAVYPDRPEGGRVADPERIRFLADHLRALRAAMDRGCRVEGYLAWSLLDNWEWAFGYARRFGLVHVDYATQKRTPKDSYAWFARIASGEISP